MHRFSSSLIDLYELAQRENTGQFPAHVLRVLAQWVGFDGAVLGMGQAPREAHPDLQITHAHVHGRDARILCEYAAVSAADPVTGAFLRGLAQPLRVNCQAVYGAGLVPALDGFCYNHHLRHLMLFGDAPTPSGAGRWLVLYRSDGRVFDEADAEYLHAAWFHVSRAIGINRAAVLDRSDPARLRRASALVDRHGHVEAADPRFAQLLRAEWPGFDGRVLPGALVQALRTRQAYRGTAMQVDARSLDAFWVCVAQPVDSLNMLTPGERAVGQRFAAGLTHKQIARELDVSPHTVRKQLTHVYAKLDVHDKAALAQRFMATSLSKQ